MITRVDELDTEPVVGRTYLVPCVTYHRIVDYGWSSFDATLPVYGHAHYDREHFNVNFEHYHLDVRFMSRRLITEAQMFGFEAPAKMMTALINCDEMIGGVEYRRLRCVRQMPEFPGPGKIKGNSLSMLSLEAAYRDTKLDLDTMRCPHKNISLKGLPCRDGKITCPGHGLCWDTQTGAMVPRFLKED